MDGILIASGTASDLVSKPHLMFCFLSPFLVPAVPIGLLLEADAKTRVRNVRSIWGRTLVTEKREENRMGRESLRLSEDFGAKILHFRSPAFDSNGLALVLVLYNQSLGGAAQEESSLTLIAWYPEGFATGGCQLIACPAAEWLYLLKGDTRDTPPCLPHVSAK